MDVLADILTVTRLSGSVGCHTRCDPPWGIRFEPAPKVWFHLIAAGGGVFVPRRGKPIALGPHDLVLLPHGDGHSLADSPTSPTRSLEQWRVRPSKPSGRTELMCGSYTLAFAEIHPVLRLLPSVIHIRGATVRKTLGMQATLDMLLGELSDRDVGSERVVSRLLEVMFVLVLRRWLDDNASTGWLGALRDEPIGQALVALHTEPAHAWSVAELARKVGLSRPVFARRFTTKVGDTPLGYLRKLRLDIASVMLHDTDESVAAIANTVGYTSEFAFNRAFQRARGTPPGRYRRALQSGDPRRAGSRVRVA
jgi:AraC-like DNA-binding protein